ncbi:MAG: stage II sporulation protein M [Myxococcota bacterium]
MAEPLSSFVSRRRADWDALGRLLEARRTESLRLEELRELDRLYRRAASDVAHAQAFFPGTDVHRFLNQLVSTTYGHIYRPPSARWAAVGAFFRHGFPHAVREELSFVAASALLFAAGLLLGAAVVWLEPRGAELLISAPLREHIAQRRMWTDGLLSVLPPGVVASAILTNNLTVAISAFGLGALFGLGTVYVLVSNGIHLGSVAALCIREEMGYPLLSFIGAHGPVELSIIILAGASGLMLGHALIDPGELPRAVFVRQRAAKAVRLLVGSAPFLALIGVVEGYVSPGDLFPAPLKIALGLLLGAAFWAYLLWRR